MLDQLRDVVVESLRRIQDRLSAPNGWSTLLWNRSRERDLTWWPSWENDIVPWCSIAGCRRSRPTSAYSLTTSTTQVTPNRSFNIPYTGAHWTGAEGWMTVASSEGLSQ